VSLAMGSHIVTCYSTQVSTPRINPSQMLVLDLSTRWPIGDRLHTEMVYLPTDGYLSKYWPSSARLGVELATCWSQVRRRHHYTTKPPWYSRRRYMRNFCAYCWLLDAKTCLLFSRPPSSTTTLLFLATNTLKLRTNSSYSKPVAQCNSFPQYNARLSYLWRASDASR